MASPVEQWIEEDYFIAISTYLTTVVGISESNVEEATHNIMDVWTFDGVLDTDSLDAIMAKWDDINWDTPMAEQYGG